MTHLEAMTRSATAVLACLVLAATAGCVRTSAGNPVAADTGRPGTSTTKTAPAPDSSGFGVVPTSRAPIPADAL